MGITLTKKCLNQMNSTALNHVEEVVGHLEEKKVTLFWEAAIDIAEELCELHYDVDVRMPLCCHDYHLEKENQSCWKSSVKNPINPPLPQISGSQRAQGPMIISKPVSYLIKPDNGNRSSYEVSEENSIDSMASDYIRKVREKNRQDLI